MMNPDTDIDPVLGLEAKYFNDKALFHRIVDEVFFKNWLLACHASQVSKPGDYQTL
jgi:phenylpropionate dioxygenase-like ring-hydroxylating dioxygenase large terminal subunit